MNTHAALWKRLAHVLISLTVFISLASPLFGATPIALAAPQFSGFLVNNGSDGDLETCAGSPSGNDCTLRGAIKKINTGNLQFKTIIFSPSVTLTALLNPLPAIVVTGTIISGNSGLPRVDAIFMTPGNVFSVSAPLSQIAGLSIVNGHPFTDGVFADIWVAGGTGVWISNNFLGTLPTGSGVSDCNPNPGGGSLVSRNSGYGVFVDRAVTGSSGASNGSVYIYGNTIGCHSGHGVVLNGADYVHIGEDASGSPAGNFIGANSAGVGLMNGAGGVGDGIALVAGGGPSGARYNIIRANTIEHNGRYGILLAGTGTNNTSSTYSNLIAGNRIGIDFLGAYANGSDGIYLGSGAFFNIIGGTTNADRNVISGNSGSGIRIVDSNANAVLGNYIGTGLTGALAMLNAASGRLGQGSPQTPSYSGTGNHLNGIWLDNSDSNQIGGGIAADRNVISGNLLAGVLIDASNSNVVNYNLIGIDAAGTSALANGQDGVWVNNGSSGNTIGSSSVGQAQYIGGNVGTGVLIISSDGNNVFQSNRIGVGPSGTPLGNGDGGVFIIDSSNNLIYPTQVSNNTGAGVALTGNGSLGNDLGPLHVAANSGLPVDLGSDGPTPNDGVPDIGPNNFLDYPVITASASHVITGTTCDDCIVFVYQAVGNPGAPGGGGDYLGSATASPAGVWSYALPGSLGKFDVTLQAKDLSSNTSEFSPRPILFLPVTRR